MVKIMGILTPKQAKWMAGISSVLIGAANITTPINLKDMVPEIATKPLLGGMSLVGLAAYGALIGGFLVLMKMTE